MQNCGISIVTDERLITNYKNAGLNRDTSSNCLTALVKTCPQDSYSLIYDRGKH